MSDQLWFTSCPVGLGGVFGFQARAASPGLQDVRSAYYMALDPYLRYDLPRGANAATTAPKDAPLSLVFADTPPHGRMLASRVYAGLNFNGRPGNVFIHAVAGLPADFTARKAIALWQSPFWVFSDQGKPERDTNLPRVDPAALSARPGPLSRNALAPMASHLSWLIQAYLNLGLGQRIFIAAPPEQVALLVWGLTHCLPEGMTQNLTFSTYEREVAAASTTIVGLCGWPVDQPAKDVDLPAACYGPNGFALNLYTYRQTDQSNRPYPALARFLARCLVHPQRDDAQVLADLLAVSDGAGVSDVKSLLGVCALMAHLRPPLAAEFGLDRIPRTQDMIAVGRSQPVCARLMLDKPDFRQAVVDLACDVADPAVDGWWTDVGQASLKALKDHARPDRALADGLARLHDEALERALNLLLAQPGQVERAEKLLIRVVKETAVQDGGGPWAELLRQTSPHRTKLRPETRRWLLERWSANLPQPASRPIEDMLAGWLNLEWKELGFVLASTVREDWKNRAVEQAISAAPAGRLAPEALETYTAYRGVFDAALKRMVQSPATVGSGGAFFDALAESASPSGRFTPDQKMDLLLALLPLVMDGQPGRTGDLLRVGLSPAEVRRVFDTLGVRLTELLRRQHIPGELANRYLQTIQLSYPLAGQDRNPAWIGWLSMWATLGHLPREVQTTARAWVALHTFLAQPAVDYASVDRAIQSLAELKVDHGLMHTTRRSVVSALARHIHTCGQLKQVLAIMPARLRRAVADDFGDLASEALGYCRAGRGDPKWGSGFDPQQLAPYLELAWCETPCLPPADQAACQERLKANGLIQALQADRRLAAQVRKAAGEQIWAAAIPKPQPGLLAGFLAGLVGKAPAPAPPPAGAAGASGGPPVQPAAGNQAATGKSGKHPKPGHTKGKKQP